MKTVHCNLITAADIAAGAYPLAVSTQNSTYAARQYEALTAIGVYANDSFTGYYATAKGSVVECESTGAVFASVASSDELVAIVRTSDVYRYGGVKVVGAVPTRLYTAMRFPQSPK